MIVATLVTVETVQTKLKILVPHFIESVSRLIQSIICLEICICSIHLSREQGLRYSSITVAIPNVA